MLKKIITIGYDIPGYAESFHTYSSDQSLLDADMVVFEPNFENYSSESYYQGKPSYDENESFRLQEDTKHWRKELSTALEEGKTIFVFFGRFEEFFVRTGQREYTGSGRSARVMNYVTSYNNYNFFPIDLPTLVSKSGEELLFNNAPIFSTFWQEFKEYLRYESYIDGKIDNPVFFTKTGKKPVGGIFKVGKGHLVLLPALRYPIDKFTRYDKSKKKEFWTDKAVQFGNRLMQVLVDIDKALRGADEVTPPPSWVLEKDFEIPETKKIKKKLGSVTQKIDSLTLTKNELLQDLTKEEELKNLLFEKGKRLQNAVLLALRILGYKAEGYDDGQLELDGIIISPARERFVAEVEGKDNSAINIDKFRQLESNIQEDLERDEVDEPAIGMLFGNGFRLTKPSERKEQFTDKCISNAKRLNVILVRTPDLFRVVKYIKESGDKTFLKKCQESIINNRGKIADFPSIPRKTSKSKKKTQ